MALERIGHYQITAKIAEGGFGTIYAGRDPRLDRPVAIKVLHAQHVTEPSRRARFAREARSAANLQHPGIVQIYDVIESEGIFALVMEYVSGASLDRYLRNQPDLTIEEKLEIAAEIADALHAAHMHGIIHRDVKPANVLMTSDGHIKLTDFGLARLPDLSLTQITGENHVIGTPAYMSPEQCEGRPAQPQSDIYSLGVIIYEMATGSLPFDAENYLALLRHHMDTPPTPVRLLKPQVPEEMENIIMRCLAKAPDERPATAAELALALRVIRAQHAHVSHDSPTLDLRTPVSPVGLNRPTPYPGAAGYTPASPVPGPVPSPHPTPSPMATPMAVAPPPEAQPQAVPSPAEGGERPPPPVEAEPRFRRMPPKPVLIAVLVLAVLGGIIVGALWGGAAKEGLAGISDATMPRIWSEAPLQTYVKAEDENYGYREVATLHDEHYTAHVIDMTSQTWHADKVSPPVWRHWLTIIVPTDIKYNEALLVLGDWPHDPAQAPDHVPTALANLADSTKSVVAVLQGLPLAPLSFHDSDKPLTRDEFMVASYMRVIETGDETWPAVFPMVKSAVRAMDTVQSFMKEDLDLDETPIDGFVLAGGADGLSTWLTAAVDARVKAFAPIMYDMLNIGEQIELEVGYHEDLSEYLRPYKELGLMPMLDAEEGQRLLKVIDPYEYRDKLTMAKLILLNPGQPMSTVDSGRLYVNELTGPTYLHHAPNTPVIDPDDVLLNDENPEHKAPGYTGMANVLNVFYHNHLVKKEMPKFTWEIKPSGEYRVDADTPPTRARLWVAKAEDRRFDYDSIGHAWVTQMLKESNTEEGLFEGTVPAPEDGYLAFYIELVYPSKLAVNYSVATPITVLGPDTTSASDTLALVNQAEAASRRHQVL